MQMMPPVRKISVYETKSRYYLVGSDCTEKNFYVLKVDRTEPRCLVFSEDSHEYSKQDLNALLYMINDSNQPTTKDSQKKAAEKAGGLVERVSKAFGLLGFIRFTEGYYMLLITKASRAAQLGYDALYKVEDVAMLYVSSATPSNSGDEPRYLRMFQSVDLSNNFFFSYTYDLSRTLQENLLKSDGSKGTDIPRGMEERFVWNGFLLEPVFQQSISSRWVLPVIHGFIGQATVCLPGATLAIILIGRRCNKFAGTRFLKRGANLTGYVANEVETEQIIWDQTAAPLAERGRFTSFVQLRGSIPLVWSQDPANRPPVVMGKPPPIQLDLADPYAQVSALHFRDLREKYGHPIVAINLCKRRERRKHESILNEEYRSTISYLNQFVPRDEFILYLSFDMARCNAAGNVLPKLEEIAYNVMRLHGWFQTFRPLYCHELRQCSLAQDLHLKMSADGQKILQTGIPRTNCIDCLDRTNVAQFVIGKVALAYQLYSMGLLLEPVLPLQTEICRLLENLYEEHGDILAVQYAGSHLVHSVRTYKKTSIFQERSRDVIQTLSRYYSNTFADYDKQNAINLFLGVYKPWNPPTHYPLWDLTTDVYLHNLGGRPNNDYCAWFLPDPLRNLWTLGMKHSTKTRALDEPDQFDVYYRTSELTSMDILVAKASGFRTLNLDSLEAETSTGGSQPFLLLWKRQTDSTPKEKAKPTKGRKKESEPQESSSDDETGARNSDTEVLYSAQWHPEDHLPATPGEGGSVALRFREPASGLAGPLGGTLGALLRRALPPMRDVYGWDLRAPSRSDMAKYTNYARLGGHKPDPEDLELMKRQRLMDWDYFQQQRPMEFGRVQPLSIFTNDSTFGSAVPVVSDAALKMYEAAVSCGQNGPQMPAKRDMKLYRDYVRSQKSVKIK